MGEAHEPNAFGEELPHPFDPTLHRMGAFDAEHRGDSPLAEIVLEVLSSLRHSDLASRALAEIHQLIDLPNRSHPLGPARWFRPASIAHEDTKGPEHRKSARHNRETLKLNPRRLRADEIDMAAGQLLGQIPIPHQ